MFLEQNQLALLKDRFLKKMLSKKSSLGLSWPESCKMVISVGTLSAESLAGTTHKMASLESSDGCVRDLVISQKKNEMFG